MPTYTQLASTYATLNAYTSSGKKIWQIEERTKIPIPQSIQDLASTDPIASQILADNPVFYEPMVNEANVNKYGGESNAYVLEEHNGTLWNRSNIKSTVAGNANGSGGFRYENRVDMSSWKYPKTVEFFYRGMETFNFFSDITSKIALKTYSSTAFEATSIFIIPRHIPIKSISQAGSTVTVKFDGSHGFSGNAFFGVQDVRYGPTSAVTGFAFAGSYCTLTVASGHGLTTGDQFYLNDPAVSWIGVSETGWHDVTAYTATSIQFFAGDRYGNASRSGSTTVTVVDNGHTLTSGNTIIVTNAINPAYNGTYVVTVLDANRFTYVCGSSATDTDSINWTRNTPSTQSVSTSLQGGLSNALGTMTSTATDTLTYTTYTSTTRTLTNVVSGWGARGDSTDGAGVTVVSDYFGTTYWSINSDTDVCDGNWHHICYTLEDSSVYEDDPNLAGSGVVATLYVDGKLVGKDGGPSAEGPLAFEWPGTAGTWAWTGIGSNVSTKTEVAHLAIYHRALNYNEVAGHAALRALPPSWQGGYLVFDGSKWCQTLI